MNHTVKSSVTVLVLMLSACATTSSSIYFSSQTAADASLAAFDKNNPDCELWSNWQKMCSRTGKGGTTICTVDPNQPVKASAPFCADTSGESRLANDSQQKSMMRFCQTLPTASSNEQMQFAGCALFSRKRPFNGYNLAARRGHSCLEWFDTQTKISVCSEDDATGTSCESLSRARYSGGPLACARAIEPLHCGLSEYGIQQDLRGLDVLVGDGLHYLPNNFPVNGLSCSYRK